MKEANDLSSIQERGREKKKRGRMLFGSLPRKRGEVEPDLEGKRKKGK